jgi:hypothetical protein
MSSPFQEKLCELAEAEVGTRESPRNSNTGPRVNTYKSATTLDPQQPWPWCAAFVCFIVKNALKSEVRIISPGFTRPTTAGAWDFINWSKAQDNRTTTLMAPKAKDIQPGDIVVFKFSHIGIAVSNCLPDGTFQTVEGNTDLAGSREGGGVYHKTRNISTIRARIRINL